MSIIEHHTHACLTVCAAFHVHISESATNRLEVVQLPILALTALPLSLYNLIAEQITFLAVT
jgi:hypothetical protein